MQTDNGFYCVVTSCGTASTTTFNVVVLPGTGVPTSVTIAVNPSGPVCSGALVTFTASAVNGGTAPIYQWMINGTPVGSNSSTYSSSSLSTGNHISCQLTSNLICVSDNPATSNTILMIVKPSLTAGITIETSTNPACSGTTVNFYATPENGGTTPAYQWKLNGSPVGTANTYSNNNLTTGDIISCVLTSNEACIIGNPAYSNDITMTLSPEPIADAGADATFSGTPIQIGNIVNGPGTITWSPSSGLNSITLPNPQASPTFTTIYTVSVDNNGCIRSDDVTINVAGSGYMLSGKTLYAGKAIAGNPAPNMPTYNSLIYDINKVIVILKNQSGTEIARDTSDANGAFSFNNVANGNYIISYDKYTADTMQWGDNVNAIDVALMKYNIGADVYSDPSRNFAYIYKKAANVDNNATVNAIDVARLKAKIGAPDAPAKNFPKGNWVKLDSAITVSNANVNITLPVICYGDYNASSSKYRDSTNNWSQMKSLLMGGIIAVSEESMITSSNELIEVPLRISSKINEFSALGLEINYPNNEFRLVSAVMYRNNNKTSLAKINSTLEEIIADDNDLLVTDQVGTIRVVYATTQYYNLAENDIILMLGFKPLKALPQGEIDLSLHGTGVIGDQFGREIDGAYLMMPKIFFQGNNNAPEFEFTGYPNPFSGEAVINYNLNESGHISLKVYNSIGDLVTELVNENQLCGKHSMVFSAKKLSPGMYTFKLDFVGKDKSKCLILKLIH